MPYDPNHSPVGWYIGTYLVRFIELAEEGNYDPERRFLLWENTVLVKAENIDEAYDKIVVIAQDHTKPYKGGPPPGVDVRWVFEGISNLLPVYEKIEDGCEVMWGKGTTKLKNIRRRARSKAVFNQKPRGFQG